MDIKDSIAKLKLTQGVHEQPIADLDRETAQLVGADGTRYEEVAESVWAEAGNGDAHVVYLQTMTHGGGICLKPLYFRLGNEWYNVTTGRFAPSSLPLPGRRTRAHTVL